LKEENIQEHESITLASRRLRRILVELEDIFCNSKESFFGKISPKFREDFNSAEEHIQQATKIIDDLEKMSKDAREGIRIGGD
jgi:hypothetical protein